MDPIISMKNMYKSSECTDSLHKLILSENVFIYNFGGIKMNEKCSKVII